MSDNNNLHFRGPGFEFNAAGTIAIFAAVVIAALVIIVVRVF